jgi:sphinganine-1-phosphate aldolase
VSAGSGLGSSNPKNIVDFLVKLSREEPVPSSGMMFTHSYETGDPVLRDLARRAFELYMDKTMLDFTVYPSLVKLERDVVSFVARLMGGGESTTGTFTYGGTESIIPAVKAARDFFKSRNPDLVPEIILPYTAHPAFVKAAVYLGLK